MKAHIQDDGSVVISRRLAVPAGEIRYRFSRGTGPGGQHVNKVSTRVELIFDIGASRVFTAEEKQRIRAALGRRVDKEGVLTIAAGESRSQWENRRRVTERFRRLLQESLRPVRPRKPTKPLSGSRERRLTSKKVRGRVKALRGRVRPE